MSDKNKKTDSRPFIKLNPKQKIFVAEYIKTSNATRSAITAGYSAKSAAAVACKMLKSAKIQEAIARFEEVVETQALVTSEEIIKELRAIAFDKSASNRDRINALTQLGRYLGLWIDRREISVEDLRAIAEKEGIDPSELQAEVESILQKAKDQSARLKVV